MVSIVTEHMKRMKKDAKIFKIVTAIYSAYGLNIKPINVSTEVYSRAIIEYVKVNGKSNAGEYERRYNIQIFVMTNNGGTVIVGLNNNPSLNLMVELDLSESRNLRCSRK